MQQLHQYFSAAKRNWVITFDEGLYLLAGLGVRRSDSVQLRGFVLPLRPGLSSAAAAGPPARFGSVFLWLRPTDTMTYMWKPQLAAPAAVAPPTLAAASNRPASTSLGSIKYRHGGFSYLLSNP